MLSHQLTKQAGSVSSNKQSPRPFLPSNPLHALPFGYTQGDLNNIYPPSTQAPIIPETQEQSSTSSNINENIIKKVITSFVAPLIPLLAKLVFSSDTTSKIESFRELGVSLNLETIIDETLSEQNITSAINNNHSQ